MNEDRADTKRQKYNHTRTETGNGTSGGAGKKRKGLIYFRKISPSDRSVIQTLHEQWFPVDYKSNFFDSLCSERPLVLEGMSSPLYCSVACFKELSDEEFEERKRRKRERELRYGYSWSSFWSSVDDRLDDDYESDDEEDDDNCTLWDMDDSVEDDTSTTTTSADERERYHEASTNTSDTSTSNNGTKDHDNNIESGDSVFSIHRRTEREKMKRFYSNSF